MATKTNSSRLAGTAIAAVLALSATPLFAQDTAAPATSASTTVAPPPIVTPDSVTRSATTAPASTGPSTTITVPDIVNTTAQPTGSASSGQAARTVMTSNPVVQQVPAAEASPEPVSGAETIAPATRSTPRNTASAETAPAAPRTAAISAAPTTDSAVQNNQIAPQGAEQTSSGSELAPLAAPVGPTLADPVAEPSADVTSQSEGNGLVMALGLLLVLGLGAGGIALLMRRRRKPVAAKAPPLFREAPVGPAIPARAVTDAPVAPVTEPVTAAPNRDDREWARPVPVRARADYRPSAGSQAGGLANTGAAVALPRSVPEDFAERDALLRRMIAAKPDRANPFVAPKARIRRARLILQSLGRKFETRDPWMDLSQYPSNWPSQVRRSQTAVA